MRTNYLAGARYARLMSDRRLEDPVLVNEWMAVAVADEISTPTKVTVLGEDVVLWRNSAGIHSFRDLCIHRGTALSLGRVEGDDLVCSYHGWRYGCSGACTLIPAQSGLPIPPKARAIRYACVERYGLVWVCLGDPKSDPPEFTEAESDGFHLTICGPYEVEAEAPRVIENFLDISHLMWVHEGFLGDAEHAQIPDYRVNELDGQLVSDLVTIYQPDPDGQGSGVSNHYVYTVIRPLTVKFAKTDDRQAGTLAIMLHTTPVDHRKTIAWAIQARDYALDVPDEQFVEFQDRIFAQDAEILVSQRPEDLPLDLAAELHLKSDRLAIAYRTWLRELGVTVGTA